MSWSIEKRGTPSGVLVAMSEDPQAGQVPQAVTLAIEEMVNQADPAAEVVLKTYGHIYQGMGEAHISLALAPRPNVGVPVPDTSEQDSAPGTPAVPQESEEAKGS